MELFGLSQKEMRNKEELKKLQDKLKMFTKMMLVDRVRDEYSMVEDIVLTKFEHNPYTNKDYPEFTVEVNSWVTPLSQAVIKQNIREYIDSFFPDIFTVLNANVKFNRI